MTIPVHISMDIETLDLRPSGVILSIGLAAFTVPGGIVGSFYTRLNREEQEAKGRTVDRATQVWWESQSDDAKEALRGTDEPVDRSLMMVESFFSRFTGGAHEIAGVWGFGSDFDNAFVQDIFRQWGRSVPWPHKKNRCGRTLVGMTAPEKPLNIGTHHNALDDAMWQAEYFRRGMKILGRVQ